jgi:hypothetical protein
MTDSGRGITPVDSMMKKVDGVSLERSLTLSSVREASTLSHVLFAILNIRSVC